MALAGQSIYCQISPASNWCATDVTAPAVAAAQPALDYWITVQRYRGGAPFREPFRLDREMVFESDYRIFLHLRTAQAGNLYIVNEGPAGYDSAGGYNLLFPKTTLNGGAPFLPAGYEIQIPESGGFAFDDEVGAETLWLVWSREQIDALEAVRGRANEVELGVIDEPAETAAIAAVLSGDDASEAVVDHPADEAVTRLRTTGDALIHRIVLEHR